MGFFGARGGRRRRSTKLLCHCNFSSPISRESSWPPSYRNRREPSRGIATVASYRNRREVCREAQRRGCVGRLSAEGVSGRSVSAGGSPSRPGVSGAPTVSGAPRRFLGCQDFWGAEGVVPWGPQVVFLGAPKSAAGARTQSAECTAAGKIAKISRRRSVP